ncbi:6-phosphogluconolactonase (plasmid) [Pseudorhodobacter turbinis]|uniref:6-phosphogluconolactonase n=1 Tax=Pseudorhodobacter turbinis TaxID=2500533 RepID=A0A4P8EL07_9RHOB|nr:6-phosphogluconolactonase [Pseudorhodobacter turbinis]QCO57950.1 6-phosphogluconolactonase [Pseudorhodobacter turbinis]
MNLIEYPDREMMMMSLANKIAGELGSVLRQKGRASLCVPGGTTPGPVFDMLSAVDLDWANVAVFLNDERWVAEDSPRSNTRLLRQRLLQDRAAKAQLVPLYAPVDQPEDAMEALAEGIAPHLPISVLLLGMGADMHTASLFPGADRLQEALAEDAPTLLPMRAPGADEPRITLTAPVLRDALNIHILITGADKRTAIERAASLPVEEAPVRAVLADATIHWAE